MNLWNLKSKHIIKLAIATAIALFTALVFPNITTAQQPDIKLEPYSFEIDLNNPNPPQNVFISNISTSGFTLNWTTNAPSQGSVVYEVNSATLTKRFLDKRDSVGEEIARYTHYVDVLDPTITTTDTIYFKILSDGMEYGINGENFEFSPPASLASPPTPDSIRGQLIEISALPPEHHEDFIVFSKTTDSLWASTTITNTSDTELTWTMPTGNILTTDMQNYADFSSDDMLSVQVSGPAEFASTVFVNDTLEDIEIDISSLEIRPDAGTTVSISSSEVTDDNSTTTDSVSEPVIDNSETNQVETPVDTANEEILDALPETSIFTDNTSMMFVLGGLLVISFGVSAVSREMHKGYVRVNSLR